MHAMARYAFTAATALGVCAQALAQEAPPALVLCVAPADFFACTTLVPMIAAHSAAAAAKAGAKVC